MVAGLWLLGYSLQFGEKHNAMLSHGELVCILLLE